MVPILSPPPQQAHPGWGERVLLATRPGHAEGRHVKPSPPPHPKTLQKAWRMQSCNVPTRLASPVEGKKKTIEAFPAVARLPPLLLLCEGEKRWWDFAKEPLVYKAVWEGSSSLEKAPGPPVGGSVSANEMLSLLRPLKQKAIIRESRQQPAGFALCVSGVVFI